MRGKKIRPIETIYKGYKFRSRLEARFAVYFDELGWKYEYEKEGFNLKSGYYLPDFYLHDKEYCEIKPLKEIYGNSFSLPLYRKELKEIIKPVKELSERFITSLYLGDPLEYWKITFKDKEIILITNPSSLSKDSKGYQAGSIARQKRFEYESK